MCLPLSLVIFVTKLYFARRTDLLVEKMTKDS